MKKLIIFVFLISLVVSFAYADFDRTSGLIDIPVAKVIKGGTWKVYSSGILTIGDYLDSPADFNTGFAYGIGDWGEVTISMLTTVDYTINFNSILLRESGGAPSIAFGMHNITYRKYVSELGQSEHFGYSDDVDYIKVARRPHEQFSLFFVSTKNFGGSYGEYTVGIGRGKYVGFGPHSHWFNSDMLFASTDQQELLGKAHEDAVGLFFGGRWQIVEPLSYMFEFDGRDVNTGISYKFPIAEVELAWTHFEQIGKSHRTRLSFGASFSSMAMPKAPEYSLVSIRVYDKDTGKALDFSVNLERNNKKSSVSGKKGKVRLKLLPGEYMMKVVIPGYKWKQIKLTLKGKETKEFKLGLERKPTKEELEKEKEFDSNFVSGVTAFNKGEYKNAMTHLERCLFLKPGHEESTSYYEKARAAFTKQFGDIEMAAKVMENKGDYKGALSKYKELLAIDENNTDIAAKVDQLTKRLQAKKAPPKEVGKKKPPTPGVTEADINKWYKQGLGYFSSGNYKKAINMFEKILRYRSGHSGAKKYLGKARTRQKALGG